VSILKKLESAPYGRDLRRAEGKERSLEDVTEAVREKVLESHPELVMQARLSREKRSEMIALVSELIISCEFYVGRLARRDLAERIVQELSGFGPIDQFLDDPSITEIMVNGSKEIFIERRGLIEKTPVVFSDDAHVLDLINRIVSGVGRRVDRSSPYVDARLPDGSRVNAVIPPLSLNGPVLTIRRFPERYSRMAELVSLGTLSAGASDFLTRCVQCRLDIVVSGGSGTGKTTSLNVLSNLAGASERLIVIEDSAEIRVPGRHVVYLETRPENLEGKGLVTVRDLLRNALRMRPDRIVIGECRGKEALDLIAAMNTGHEGCLSTVHANSAADCLARLLSMALMSEEAVPLAVLESWLGSALDVIVHQAKRPDGARVVSEIALVGIDDGRLCSSAVYTQGRAETVLELPAWFVEKVGAERVRQLLGQGGGP
jgi:pilus assembly protein CpaF